MSIVLSLLILRHACKHSNLKLSSDKLGISLSAERLRTLDRGAESTVNDELRKDTKSTGNTKEDSVVVGLGKTVVLKEDTRVLPIRLALKI